MHDSASCNPAKLLGTLSKKLLGNLDCMLVRYWMHRRVIEDSSNGPSVKDIDDAVEAFMKRQAELESGGT
jgi:hypothetical protein